MVANANTTRPPWKTEVARQQYVKAQESRTLRKEQAEKLLKSAK
jgi:hypothetical protein